MPGTLQNPDEVLSTRFLVRTGTELLAMIREAL
jgi:hypothetical protein